MAYCNVYSKLFTYVCLSKRFVENNTCAFSRTVVVNCASNYFKLPHGRSNFVAHYIVCNGVDIVSFTCNNDLNICPI